MSGPLTSNGFGSFQQLIAIQVDAEHAQLLLEIDLVTLLEERDGRLLVEYPRWTTRPHDDETVVYELRSRLSALGIPYQNWSIDWDRSSF